VHNVPSLRRAFVAICLAAAIGCGGPSSPTSPSQTNQPPAPPAPPPVATTTVAYSGLFGSGMFTGTVTLSAQVPATATLTNPRTAVMPGATGTAKFSGASTTTVNLTGTYDTTSNRFLLSGGGWAMDVTVADARATGTISTPAGAGSVAALVTTAGSPVAQYCGSYSGTESGKFLVVVRGGLVSGVAAEDGRPGGVTLAGSANGNSVSLSWSWTEGVGGQGLATGTINGQSISGTWSNSDGQSGAWSGSGC
jgi:hypothetical protein